MLKPLMRRRLRALGSWGCDSFLGCIKTAEYATPPRVRVVSLFFYSSTNCTRNSRLRPAYNGRFSFF